MSVFTERQAIKQRMSDIREERRELASEYYKLMDRLRELDSKEREAIDTESVVGSLTDAVNTLSSMVPHIPAQALIKSVAEKLAENQVTVTVEEEEVKEVAPEHVIADQQYRDSEKHLTEKPQRIGKMKSSELDNLIVSILKEAGVPMRLVDIRNKVQEEIGYEINQGTFHNRVNRISENNPKVQKAMRGYYQYVL